jgi:peptidoglycan hydrolase-like protein with peptidoglycan-binding domain
VRIGRPRRRWLAAFALALGVLAVLAVVLLDSRAPKRASADTGVPPGDTTAIVTRRTLSEGSTVDGTLGYGGKLELYDRLAGTYTWLPAVGAVVRRGGTLFRIDDLPVVLMYGSVPAYRTLKQGVGDGPDVAELNSNLIDLGYDPYGAIVDDDVFSAATAAAVRRWQKAAGLRETGEVELGRIVFAPDARRVTEVHVGLGQDPPAARATSPGKRAKKRKPKHPKRAKRSPAKTPASTSSRPSKSSDAPSKAPSGEQSPSAGSGELALSTSSAQQIVTLKVKAEQQQLAHVGERVPVTLPGGGVVRGRITGVGTVASEAKASGDDEKGSPSDEGSEAATIDVTVALERPVAHLDEAPVSVELVRSVRRDVLVVPATALVATAGGGYAVEALQGARRVTVAVTPGMFASGYVEVEGAGVREGLKVIEAQ